LLKLFRRRCIFYFIDNTKRLFKARVVFGEVGVDGREHGFCLLIPGLCDVLKPFLEVFNFLIDFLSSFAPVFQTWIRSTLPVR
jgi:hypothetical protein